jgi:transposase-like protein
MPQTATIKSLPAAFRMMKAMQAEGVEWGEDYRQGARDAVAELLRGRMDHLIDEHLERMVELGWADRRNGCYRRHLLTELGEIELAVPRTRSFSALRVVRAYARRAKDVDRMILACFLLGLSTRKVAVALLPVLGRPVSPATVSQVAKQLDAAVAAFHRRPLQDQYRVLVLDGVVLKRKTGAGALARPVLVALGLRPDGKKEVIDFRLAAAESAAQWELFLGDLVRRGLVGERLEMLCADGGAGLLAALPTAYPEVPVQRCWAHKIRNVLNKVHKPDQAAIKAGLHRIMNAATLPPPSPPPAAMTIAGRAATPRRSRACAPTSPILLTCFRYPTLEERKAVKAHHAIGDVHEHGRLFNTRRRPMAAAATGVEIASLSFDPGRRPGQSKARASSCSERSRTIR